MLSLTTRTPIPSSNHRASRLNACLIPALFLALNSKKRDNNCKKALFLGFRLTEEWWGCKSGRNLGNSWCFRCQQSDGDVDLEAEILGFMAKSEKPTMFPTKEELLRAGREDLVNFIKMKGGWFSFGWDDEPVGDDVKETTGSDIAEFHRRVESCKQSGSSSFFDVVQNSTSRSLDSRQISLDTSSQLAANEDSGILSADEDSGIDGILSRLKKWRNNNLMEINLEKDRLEARPRSEDKGDDIHSDASSGFGRSDLVVNDGFSPVYHHKGELDSSGRNIRHYTEPETWRSWSSRRARSQHAEFEAAEISFGKDSVDADRDSYHDGMTVITKDYDENPDKHKEISYKEIRNRLQYLESELRTALQSVRSNRVDSISKEVTASSSELHDLSDALEFQENEVMSAKERLRSIRAKLAIIEGKMTLTRTNAQKILELKNRQIDDARRSLKLLRSTSIVWHSSASEVLVTGSFDGWTTQLISCFRCNQYGKLHLVKCNWPGPLAVNQLFRLLKRRMQKSKSGMFSITLKLYPGRYEIKFIVDGQWKVDPLRPIVYNNGYQNNLYIVT